MTSTHDRRLAVLIHLGSYLGCVVPILGLVVPLGLWLTAPAKNRYVVAQGREWANFLLFLWISGLVLGLVGAVIFLAMLSWLGPHTEPTLGASLLAGALLGLPALLFFGFAVSQPAVAAYRCSRGEDYRYPLAFRVLKNPR